jgi:hypothetical protein
VIRVTGALLRTLQLATSRWILTVGPKTGRRTATKALTLRDKPFEPLATTLVSSATHPRFGAQLAIRYPVLQLPGAGSRQIMGNAICR